MEMSGAGGDVEWRVLGLGGVIKSRFLRLETFFVQEGVSRRPEVIFGEAD